ncbi:MAG: C25 family cysteine peptidase [Pseudomonadota bacterium]
MGRLPARDTQSITQWVQKIIDNEGVAHGKALVLTDTSEAQLFKDMSTHMIEQDFPSSWMQGSRECLSANNTLSDILSASPNRMDLVVYVGHAQPQGWGNYLQLGEVTALPEVIWTLGASLDCYDGHFADPIKETLAWDLARGSGQGAIGFYAPSSVAAPPEHREVFGKLIEELSGNDPIRIGAAILAAEQKVRADGEVFADVA